MTVGNVNLGGIGKRGFLTEASVLRMFRSDRSLGSLDNVWIVLLSLLNKALSQPLWANYMNHVSLFLSIYGLI